MSNFLKLLSHDFVISNKLCEINSIKNTKTIAIGTLTYIAATILYIKAFKNP